MLSDIDVAAKMKEKLDRDMPRYRILGACNPPLAWDAIHAVEDIGLLLPCIVVVYEGDEAGTSVVGVLDPRVQLGVTGRDDIGHMADHIDHIKTLIGVEYIGIGADFDREPT